MTFQKTAKFQVLGIQDRGSWQKTATGKYSSVYMDGGLSIDIEAALDTVADAYAISRDPSDYLLIPARANSADRPNENMDAWSREELLRFDPKISRRIYQTYLLKPHFVNHNAANYALARGLILDAHYNDVNSANDSVKEAVCEATGKVPQNDEFVECLVAMDMSKDPVLAEAYRTGSVDQFSMGCDVESTECSICGKVATTTFQFCDHVRGKLSKQAYPLDVGGKRRAFEWCLGTIFAELSGVDDPADKDANVQDGLLQVADYRAGLGLTANGVNEISVYVAKNFQQIPESLASLINSALPRC